MSSSNLNDIASALEKLNISDEQIATIKSYLADVIGYNQVQNGLGQLISVLATARSQDKKSVKQNVETLHQQISAKGNCNIKTLKYTGNDQRYLAISGFEQDPKFMVIFASLFDYVLFYPSIQLMSGVNTSYALSPNLDKYRTTYTNGTLTIDLFNASEEPNRTGEQYNVVCFY